MWKSSSPQALNSELKVLFGSFWFFFFQEKELKTRYGVRFGHGEVAVLYAVGLVAPGGVDVIRVTIQLRGRPDMIGGGPGAAVDALQLQQQIVGRRVAIADGDALIEQPVGSQIQAK